MKIKRLYFGAPPFEQSDMRSLQWTLAATGLLLGISRVEIQAATSIVAGGGAPYTIDIWDGEDGLPQNSILAITQTPDGYLWLGTLNGLVRFDGIRFTVLDEDNTPGLNSSRIVNLFQDTQGRLWIGTETAGIALMENGRMTRPSELGLRGSERRLAAACESADGAVWLHEANGDLWRHFHGRFTPFLLSGSRQSSFRTIMAEPSGPVWVGTDRTQCAVGPIATNATLELPVAEVVNLKKLDFLLASPQGGYWRLADGRIQKCRTNRVERDFGPYPWKGAPVSAACEDRQGNLLVGTLGAGLFSFNATGQATCLSTNQGLSYNFVVSLFVDREGSLWVGTDGGGLNRVRRQVFEVFQESRGSVVQSACEDREGGLWIGLNAIGANANGIAYRKNGETRWFGPEQGLVYSSVRTVFVDRDDRVWAGTWGAGLFLLQNGRFDFAPGAKNIPPRVHAIHQDRGGGIWVGTQGGLAAFDGQDWKLYTTENGLSANDVQAIADDASGNLWVGTVGGGLNRLERSAGKFTVFHKKTNELPSENVSSLYHDGEGVLWIGTDGGGLARLQNGQWTRYTTREGLISNSVGYLVEDVQGYLWIGSNAGLMRIEKKALNDVARGLASVVTCRAYGKSDGLPMGECTIGSQPGACRTQSGTLWFPTIQGIVSVNPAELKRNPHPPPVMIESVLIDGEAVNTNRFGSDWLKSVTVPAFRERLEIHYASLNLTAPAKARFKYRLAGHETDWTEAGNERTARYTKLPPGHYQFEVTACNEDGVWNETGRTLEVTVVPPFWRTWWFLSASGAAVLIAIISAVSYLSTQKLHRQLSVLKQQEAVEKDRSRIARDIHDQLGASLTQVSLLGELVESDKHSPDDVEAHARQISQTARETTRVLDEIVWTVNPSNDTLEGLVNYVCKNAQEYLAIAGLRYRLDVPSPLPDRAVSPEVRHNVFLASKEAITNVVRHAQASSVEIRFRVNASSFDIAIEDDGRGLPNPDAPAVQSRNGVRNMRKRMDDIGGGCTIQAGSRGGTVVCLSGPLGKEALPVNIKSA